MNSRKTNIKAQGEEDPVNVQAACNIFCRFMFLGVVGPGVLPDRVAIHKVDLMD